MNLAKIVIFQEDEKAINYLWGLPDNSQLNRKPIAVKSFEYDKQDFLDNNEVIINNKNFDLDTVFYLHPNKDKVYIEQSRFEDYIFRDKIFRYIQMAQKLGARKVNFTAELLTLRKMEIKTDGSISYPTFKLDGEYKKATEEKFRKTYIDNTEYIPSENYDLVKNFNEAKQWIKDENLFFDQELVHFVNSRNPETGNLLSKKILSTRLSQETNELLEISANLTVGSVFSLKANFKEDVSNLKELLLKMEIEF